MSDRLYNLMPAIYRIRDVERGEPLRALLGIIEEQFDLIERDIAGLYDDWFIETSEEWVVPYLGGLLGVRMLHNIESSGVYSQRAFVANTLRYRRRKGTLLMLEDLARDVTGWHAHAVAFFELLEWTQHLNHLRFDFAPNPNPRNPEILNPHAVNRVGTVNLRSLNVVGRIDKPFDICTHTLDIRPPGQSEGWHSIRNLGIFLWRLQSYPMREVQPVRSKDYADGFHFSPLGNPIPLFNNPDRKAGEVGLASETNVPGHIRPVAFYQDPEAYYGVEADKSLAIYGGADVASKTLQPIPVDAIICKDLSEWSPPPSGKMAVDVRLGRFAFAPGETPDEGVTVTYHHGFSGDIGGGPYDRRGTLEKANPGDWIVTVAKVQPDPPPAEWRATLAAALDDWNPTTQPRAVITIADNGTYYEEELSVNLTGNQHLIIQADSRNRPTVRFLDSTGALSVLTVTGGSGQDASFTLNSLLMEGSIRVDADSLGELEVLHCTMVPGLALKENGQPVAPAASSIDVDPDNAELEVKIQSCIVGSLRMPEDMTDLTVRDSIIDHPKEDIVGPPLPRMALAQTDSGDEPGPPTTLERVTIFGEVLVKSLTLASEVIFNHRVVARQRQAGCVRYSYVDDLISITPRRFRCQPDLALEPWKKKLSETSMTADEETRIRTRMAQIRSRMRPDFTSVHYGNPSYAQLSFNIAEEIFTGAEDSSEMGAFEHLKQPQREANLRIRLDEYMPYGLQAGIIYVT